MLTEVPIKAQISTNNIHGIDSVNDIRSWSFSSECRRKHFLDQMLNGSKTGEEKVRENIQFNL